MLAGHGVLLLLVLPLSGCASGPSAEVRAACAAASEVAAAAPWPPPSGTAIESAIRTSGDAQLIAALDAALAEFSDHELVAGGHVGVAPTEAETILTVCQDLGV